MNLLWNLDATFFALESRSFILFFLLTCLTDKIDCSRNHTNMRVHKKSIKIHISLLFLCVQTHLHCHYYNGTNLIIFFFFCSLTKEKNTCRKRSVVCLQFSHSFSCVCPEKRLSITTILVLNTSIQDILWT